MFSVKRDAHKKNYTCVSNQLLRDERLSLEAKGFMAVVLSLPDDWEFSVRGMVSLCGVAKSQIYRLLTELQHSGYLKIKQEKEGSRFLPVHYSFCELPEKTVDTNEPDVLDAVFPLPDFPLPQNEEPQIEEPENEVPQFSVTENLPQSNTNIPSIEKIINTVLINQSERTDEEKEIFTVDKGSFSEESGEDIVDVEFKEVGGRGEAPKEQSEPAEKEKPTRYTFDQVCLQINAQRLAVVYERTMVHRIAYLIADCINGGARKINGELIPAETIRERFLAIRGEDVGAAINSVGKRELKSFDAYYITTLYNTVTDRLTMPKKRTYSFSEDEDEQMCSIDVEAVWAEVLKKYQS